VNEYEYSFYEKMTLKDIYLILTKLH